MKYKFTGEEKKVFGRTLKHIDTEYRPLKKDKTPAKNMKRLENGVCMKFCPHCGEEFK